MTNMLAGLFVSGRVVEAIIVLTVLEGAALTVLWRRAARGIEPAKLWPNLLAGLALLLALLAVQTGATWPWLGVCLLGAGLAHIADLLRRWNPH